MNVTIVDGVRIALILSGVRQKDLAAALNTSANSFSNKMQRNTLTANDLAAIARFLGAELTLSFPDGQKINLTLATSAEE